MKKIALTCLLLSLAAGCLTARRPPPETTAERGQALLARARQRYERGDWPGALRETERARQVFLAIDDRLGQARALNDRGALALALGERDSAEQTLGQAHHICDTLVFAGDTEERHRLRTAIELNLARAKLAGEPREMETVHFVGEQARDYFASRGDDAGQAGALLFLARAALATWGEEAQETARSHLNEAVRLAERAGDQLLLARAHLARGRFLLSINPAIEGVRADLERALALFKGEGEPPRPENPPGILATLVALARMQAGINEPEAAAAAWQRAAGVAAHIPWHPLAAQCPPRADAP